MNKIANEGAFKINNLIHLDVIDAPQITPFCEKGARYAVTFINKAIKAI